MVDLSFAITIPVLYTQGLVLVVTVFGLMLVYWLIKLVASILTGG